MLVKVKNPELYRAWIAYLVKLKGTSASTPEIRTSAFFNSQQGMTVPLCG